jgi:hypothetical protein
VDLLNSACEGLLQWETDVKFTIFPDEIQDIKIAMQGWTRQFYDQISSLPNEIANIINAPNAQGQHIVNLVFEPPTNLDTFLKNLEVYNQSLL